MALTWNAIKDRAFEFAKEWEGESRERAEKDTFWNDFFNVFGVSRRDVAEFEYAVTKIGGKAGKIDLLWPGTLLVEHKSRGKDLEAAFEQAKGYVFELSKEEAPRYVLVCDFDRFKLYDRETKNEASFELREFPLKIDRFAFIAERETRTFREEDPVNVEAAERMGKLHDLLKEKGYVGHPLEVFLVRLLFCLFADDTGIFNEKNFFQDFIETKTNPDGSDLGAILSELFQVLNTPEKDRIRRSDDYLARFPHVNGKLFEEPLRIPSFDASMREMLLECANLDWGQISPAIFGGMFQSVMNPEERRNLGAHYTSEKNILKLIEPLFLDELWNEFETVKNHRRKLEAFHRKLASLKFLDPACGCGNFLVVTYRELRLLELEALKKLHAAQQVTELASIVLIDVDRFYGVEREEFPARIAETALWLIDHQMNLRVSKTFGKYYARIPLEKSANIVHGNALKIDWETVVPKNELAYVLGNPPFSGSKCQSEEQRKEMKEVFRGVKGAGVLDYVSAWYLLAAKYARGTPVKTAFVSTNSISQGEQTGVLWSELFHRYGVKIHFAHTTFKWSNEAKNNAGVYVVIVGFGHSDVKTKRLWSYEDVKGEPAESIVKNVNPYLVEGTDVFITNRQRPICDVPLIGMGNKPIDGGRYIFKEDELKRFLEAEPCAEEYVRPFVGAEEFLQNKKRWILWLGEAPPDRLRNMPKVLERVEAVKKTRGSSKSQPTRKLAATPTRFHIENFPQSDYLLIPGVSSERRKYIPIGFLTPDQVASNSCLIIPEAGLFHFGVLTS